jgi:argininosuccinate lyase
MQEDKEPVFDAADSLALALAAMAGMVGDLEPVPEAMRNAAAKGYPTATDLADWLVSVAGLPFREAHRVTGEIVKAAEARGVMLDALPVSDMQAIEARITDDVLAVLSIDAALARRTSEGGTAPDNVRAAVAAARKRFLEA